MGFNSGFKGLNKRHTIKIYEGGGKQYPLTDSENIKLEDKPLGI